MPFLIKTGCELFYETYGEHGPWLTLINGHTRSSSDFRLMAASLSKAGFRCLTFDNRGSGATLSAKPFSVAEMVLDVIDLWQELKIEKSHLLGISMGGMLSQIIAAKNPLRVMNLILVSTTAYEKSILTAENALWGSELEEIEARLRLYVTPAFCTRNKILIAAMAKNIAKAIATSDFNRNAQLQRDAIRGLDNRSLLAEIRCPSLILHGQEDQIIPVEQAEFLASHIHGATLKILPGIGHLLLAECSKDFASYVLEFLS